MGAERARHVPLTRIIHKPAAIRCNRVQVGGLRSSCLIHRDFPEMAIGQLNVEDDFAKSSRE